jgi:hypothetical protein
MESQLASRFRSRVLLECLWGAVWIALEPTNITRTSARERKGVLILSSFQRKRCRRLLTRGRTRRVADSYIEPLSSFVNVTSVCFETCGQGIVEVGSATERLDQGPTTAALKAGEATGHRCLCREDTPAKAETQGLLRSMDRVDTANRCLGPV